MAQNGGNQEDIVDTIAQYDLDEDFPDYANEQNKELNQIVSKAFNCQIDSNPQQLCRVEGLSEAFVTDKNLNFEN